jgi:5-methyltetrahydrofolate--homocysteine methyltransferase
VPDASRSVGVCTSLLSDEQRADYVVRVKAEAEKTRAQHKGKKGQGPHHRIAAAREHGQPTDWSVYRPPAPALPGVHVLADYPLAELAAFIDWTPFFQTWELAGRYPAILDDAIVGEAARNLFADAQAMLRRIIDEKWLTANGIVGLFPAARVRGDDVELYTDASRGEVAATFHFLRQQMVKPDDRFNHSLADYIAPRDAGVPDWMGAFAVTAGGGIDERVAEYEARHDDYNAIMLKALADRLAEAFAERLHQRVRREFWGYAAGEELSVEALIGEHYRGIRPAPGYPACPDHSEKTTLFDLLAVPGRTGIHLTEGFAMLPAAAVSGFYFSHPEARYFATGRIDRDQVEDYAARKGVTVVQAERWLAPVLSYDPD